MQIGPRTEKRGSKPRMPLKHPAKSRHQVARLEISHSLVPRRVRICVMLVEKRPYSAANGLASTSTDSTLCAGQLEIEIAGRRIDEAGAAHLQRALGRLPAPDAQAAVRVAHDARQQRQQALEVVALERRDLEHEPDSMSLIDTGCTLSVGDGVSARTSTVRRHEGERRVEQDLRGFADRAP